MCIEYKINQKITAAQFITLLKKTSLGVRRPLDDENKIQGMLNHANLIVTAWSDQQLVGIARSVTDFHFCCYLSDLAVDDRMQSQGIGARLIAETKQALDVDCKIILLAAPMAESYYPKIGFEAHNSAWVLSDINTLTFN